MKQCFGSALPKDNMKSCFKAILLIIVHTVGGFVLVDGKNQLG